MRIVNEHIAGRGRERQRRVAAVELADADQPGLHGVTELEAERRVHWSAGCVCRVSCKSVRERVSVRDQMANGEHEMLRCKCVQSA